MTKKTLVQLKLQISNFKKSDLKSLTYDRIAKRIELIMDQYAHAPAEFNFNGPLYRARINEENEEFCHISNLWYRIENVDTIQTGRFNKEGESLFYASCELNTAVFELQPKIGDVITVMEAIPINVVARVKVILAGLSKSKSSIVTQDFKQERVVRNMLNNGDKRWIVIDNFLEEVLTEVVSKNEKFKYHSTVAIAELLFKIPKTEAICYPSIATSFKGVNLCMRRESVDKILKPSKCSMLEIVKIVDHSQLGEQYEFRNIKSSSKISDSGEIFWDR